MEISQPRIFYKTTNISHKNDYIYVYNNTIAINYITFICEIVNSQLVHGINTKELKIRLNIIF